MLAAAGLGVIHLLDHVLRADHSGWPFLDEVTPFTFFAVAGADAMLKELAEAGHRDAGTRRRPLLRLLGRYRRFALKAYPVEIQ